MTASGTAADPWVLRTPPGTSEFTMHRDDGADPPELVCQVGSTKLRYLARCLDDVPAMLREHGDWMELAAPTRTRRPRTARSRRGPVLPTTRSAVGTACARATAVASRCTCRRCSRSSASSSSSTTRATTASGPSESGRRAARPTRRYRLTRAPPPATRCSTSASVAMDVSPGVVMARAPWAAPYSTASIDGEALQQAVDQAGGEAVAAADAVEDLEVGPVRGPVQPTVGPGDRAPVVAAGGPHGPQGGRHDGQSGEGRRRRRRSSRRSRRRRGRRGRASTPGTSKPSAAVKSSSLPMSTSTCSTSRRLTSTARAWPPNAFHRLAR